MDVTIALHICVVVARVPYLAGEMVQKERAPGQDGESLESKSGNSPSKVHQTEVQGSPGEQGTSWRSGSAHAGLKIASSHVLAQQSIAR